MATRCSYAARVLRYTEDRREAAKHADSFFHRCEVADRHIDPLEFIAWCKACGIEPAKGIGGLERQS